MDVLTKDQRSYCMSRISGKNTKPEMLLRKSIWESGLRYRIHYKLPGKPDIVIVKAKVVIFVDGCFWHGCPQHGARPKTNISFWQNKIESNIRRDKKNHAVLNASGWMVLRFWEHEIKCDLGSVSVKILNIVNREIDRI